MGHYRLAPDPTGVPLRELRRSEDGSISTTGFLRLLDRVAQRSSNFVGLDVLFGAASDRLLADRPRIRLGLVTADLVVALPTAFHRAFGQLERTAVGD